MFVIGEKLWVIHTLVSFRKLFEVVMADLLSKIFNFNTPYVENQTYAHSDFLACFSHHNKKQIWATRVNFSRSEKMGKFFNQRKFLIY